ncbi:hypothetical protein BC829DRAFT_249188 [Chytridium lagenaria]|nr:hypothetical protein BC829DRAFT_249188 [Chytridium lagenaria]
MEEMNLDSVKGGGAHAKRRVKDAYDRENGETKMEAWARRFWESGGAIKVMASIPIQMMAFVVPVSGEFFQVFGIGIPPSVQFARYKLWAGISMAKLFLRFPLYKIIITKMPGLPLPVSRLLKANFFYLTLAHVDACLFFALDLTVDSPLRWVDVHHLIKDKKGTHYVSFVTQYLECLRESLCTIQMRVREVSAELNMETAWSIGELALGILVAGTVAGVVESLVERLDSNSELMERSK